MAIPLTVNRFDPASVLTTPARPLAGIIETGAITPSDTVDYGDNIYARWLYVGTTGNITYVKWDGTTQALSNVAAGIWHPIHSVRVKSTGTTATGLVWGA